MRRRVVWIGEWVDDMLNDEAVQIAVFGQAYAYMKKHNRITKSSVIRTIIETYLRERGFLE